MKRILSILVLAALLLAATAAFADSSTGVISFPAYGYTIVKNASVRVFPGQIYPNWGTIILGAPVTVIGEEGDTWLCKTAVGTGYIPKQFIKFLSSEEEFAEYSKTHPSKYNKPEPKPPKGKGPGAVEPVETPS